MGREVCKEDDNEPEKVLVVRWYTNTLPNPTQPIIQPDSVILLYAMGIGGFSEDRVPAFFPGWRLGKVSPKRLYILGC